MKETHDVALYRKYRPHVFKDVIGQDHIVSVLKKSIEQGNVAHAYLFAGSRGTGKTSVARIFAHAIGTNAQDLYEIDAASNRGIDDIRELRESVHTLPFESKYKVYIVDEVHMLTKEAFNALLKTLEEPPAHVIFILATTEVDKLPETVVSRCQVFTFKKPNQLLLKKMVMDIAQEEGVALDASSADLIALLGDGSFRDTIGVLQKVLSSTGKKNIVREDVEMITGAPRTYIIHDIVEAISEKKLEQGLSAVRKAVEQNIDMMVCMKLLLETMRFILLLQVAPAMKTHIEQEVSEEDFAWLTSIAGNKHSHISSAVLVELLSAFEQTPRAYISQIPLELMLVKVCSVE